MANNTSASKIIFPLRTNVAFFQTPQGFLALEERLKVATLVYDTVFLEGGFYSLQASANGVVDSHHPMNFLPEGKAAELRAQYEALSRQDPAPEFIFAIEIPGSSAGPIPLAGGRTQQIFFAEFQSLIEKIGDRDRPWFNWMDSAIVPGSKLAQWVDQQDFRDEHMAGVGAELTNPLLRSHIIHSLNNDLALSAVYSASMSVDPLHVQLLEQKQSHLGLVPSQSHAVVRSGLPAVVDVPWNEIIDLRNDPGMTAFREVVGEIDGEIAASENLDPDQIVKAWQGRLADTISNMNPSLKQLAKTSVLNLLLDFVPIPGLGTLLGVAQGAREVANTRRSWTSVFIRISR